jgi:hypothetical protein
MPADPISPLHESDVAVLVRYRQMRQSGWPRLGAAAFLAALIVLGAQDPDSG